MSAYTKLETEKRLFVRLTNAFFGPIYNCLICKPERTLQLLTIANAGNSRYPASAMSRAETGRCRPPCRLPIRDCRGPGWPATDRGSGHHAGKMLAGQLP